MLRIELDILLNQDLMEMDYLNIFFMHIQAATRQESGAFTGNGLAFPNGKGIDFSASEGPGASSSILDDYEEGTFDPLFSNGGTATYQQRAGYYVKTGRQCTIHVQLRLALTWIC